MPSGRARVVIVRGDGIGDALALGPLVAALRDAGHEVGALLSTRNREAFAAGTFCAVHVLERIPWPRHGSTPQTYERALAEARAQSYDVALVASEEPEAYRFAREAHVSTRVGFTNGVEKPLKSVWARAQLTRAIVRPASAQRAVEHEAQTLFRLGRGLHGETAPTRDAARLRPLVVAPAASHGRVVVQITRKLAALGVDPAVLRDAIAAVAAEYPSVAVADPSEAEFAREMAAACGIELEITESVQHWKALIAGARVLVTPDCGAAHVAGMTAVSCIDLFPATAGAAQAMRRWYPWASPRVWAIEVNRRVAAGLSMQLLAGIAYAANERVPSPSAEPAA